MIKIVNCIEMTKQLKYGLYCIYMYMLRMYVCTYCQFAKWTTMHMQEIFGGGKFWWTIQVKAIGEEKFGK